LWRLYFLPLRLMPARVDPVEGLGIFQRLSWEYLYPSADGLPDIFPPASVKLFE
jgi:hypothetical protein